MKMKSRKILAMCFIGSVRRLELSLSLAFLLSPYFLASLYGCKAGNSDHISPPVNDGKIVLTTLEPSGVTVTTAISGGTILSDGGIPISKRGVCWGINHNPTIQLPTKTTNSIGLGAFQSSINGLTAGTKYYVRAYGMNSVDTAYGNEEYFTTPFAIGAHYGGGIIFYIDSTGVHGLIAALSDQSNAVQWYNGSYITTGATATTVGSGLTNTNLIIAAQGTGTYAASVCRDYEGGGFNDWFLPSKDELNLLYLQQAIVGGFVGGVGATHYWSSTETAINGASDQEFDLGAQNSTEKIATSSVRAVRQF